MDSVIDDGLSLVSEGKIDYHPSSHFLCGHARRDDMDIVDRCSDGLLAIRKNDARQREACASRS
jgi:hypothetical protein